MSASISQTAPLVPGSSLRLPRRSAIAACARPDGAAWKPQPWWVPVFLRIAPPEREGSNGSEAGKEEGKKAAGRAALTAGKARVLRRRMRASESWHDSMYHSAIASRLASPDPH